VFEKNGFFNYDYIAFEFYFTVLILTGIPAVLHESNYPDEGDAQWQKEKRLTVQN
jgi:hypothetical protein